MSAISITVRLPVMTQIVFCASGVGRIRVMVLQIRVQCVASIKIRTDFVMYLVGLGNFFWATFVYGAWNGTRVVVC